MGRPIVYCDKCGKLLKEADFEQGRAHTVENRAFCSDCRPLPPPQPVPGAPHAFRPPSSGTHRRLVPVPPAMESTPRGGLRRPSSNSLAPVPPARNADGKKAVIVGGLVGGGLLIAVIIAVATSGSDAPKTGDTGEFRTRGTAPPPPPPPPSKPGDESAKWVLSGALEYRRLHPNDLAGQIRRFEEAERQLAGSPFLEDLRRELAAARRRVAEELADVEQRVAAHVRADEYGKAVAVWRAAQSRYDLPEWTREAAARAARLQQDAERASQDLRAKGADAAKRGDAAALAELQARVQRWEWPEHAEAFAKAVEAAKADRPAPPPPPPPPANQSAELWALKRKEALPFAAGRDYPEAIKRLEAARAGLSDEAAKKEAAEDVELVKAASGVVAEAYAAIAKWAKGQKAAVEYRDAAGGALKIEDVLLRADANRLEFKLGSEGVVVPLGEVHPRTLAALYRAKAGADARAAGAFLALEGEVEGAAPERLRPALDAAAEADARRRFDEAEGAYFDPSRTVEAAASYRALLQDRASTAFVRRNRGALASRTEPMKEFFLLHGELAAGGSFKSVRGKKVDPCWVSEKDVHETKRRENYVDVAFPAAPDAVYRCWVYVGGCCNEVFTFHVQGSEMTGPDPKMPRQTVAAEPGSEHDLAVKHGISGLKKKHEDHLGPKEPDRWDWVAIPLPKYATAGLKRVRITTDQKGFAVAYACVSATRTREPSERDVKDAERIRAETPGWASKGGVKVGVLLREWWDGIGGGGVAELVNAPKYKGEPTGKEFVSSFAGPQHVRDDYGTRYRGYVHPPVSGEYVFWISADDTAELWLSEDDDPAKKQKIAWVKEWCGVDEYTKHPEQKSVTLRFEAGKRYYIEALHKEGGGGDHLSVKWQLPDGKQEAPIPGMRLSPWSR